VLECFTDGDQLDDAKAIADAPESLQNYRQLMSVKSRVKEIRSSLSQILDEFNKGGSGGKAIADTFELFAEPHLIQPTIIY
jgi:lysyl-tRNA synthetase class II